MRSGRDRANRGTSSMAALLIHDRRERMLVRTADLLLGVAAGAARPFRARASTTPPRRILLLRLERIGDLVMALPAMHGVRALAPGARVDLAVGSWNVPIAQSVPWVDRVLTVDAAWLARGTRGVGLPSLMRTAAGWRADTYDLAINFEPDIRSNLLAAMSGARRTAGWTSGGGGPLLDVKLDYDPERHTTVACPDSMKYMSSDGDPCSIMIASGSNSTRCR